MTGAVGVPAFTMATRPVEAQQQAAVHVPKSVLEEWAARVRAISDWLTWRMDVRGFTLAVTPTR